MLDGAGPCGETGHQRLYPGAATCSDRPASGIVGLTWRLQAILVPLCWTIGWGNTLDIGCGVITDVQNGVSAAAQDVRSFVYRYSGDIATVSSILAYVTIEIPGVGEVFGAVAIAAGALSTERDIAVEHNLAAAVLDAAGTISGVGSVGADGLAALLRQASEDSTTLGPVAEWLAQDAASKEALSNFLTKYGAALSTGSFTLNQLIQLVSSPDAASAATNGAGTCE